MDMPSLFQTIGSICDCLLCVVVRTVSAGRVVYFYRPETLMALVNEGR